jgi:hypothetical protein
MSFRCCWMWSHYKREPSRCFVTTNYFRERHVFLLSLVSPLRQSLSELIHGRMQHACFLIRFLRPETLRFTAPGAAEWSSRQQGQARPLAGSGGHKAPILPSRRQRNGNERPATHMKCQPALRILRPEQRLSYLRQKSTFRETALVSDRSRPAACIPCAGTSTAASRLRFSE